MNRVSREKDERDLAICAMRANGWSYGEIGEKIGCGKNAAIGTVRRVRRDDLKHSGEPAAIVEAEYEPKGQD